jgi:hypothetical protein
MMAPGPVALSAVADPNAYRWRELRRRQLRALSAGAAFLVVSVVGACLLPSNITRVGLALLVAAAVAPLVFALASYPCPRCKHPFFDRSREEGLDFFTTRCLHCGIAIGTPKASTQAMPSESQSIRIILS